MDVNKVNRKMFLMRTMFFLFVFSLLIGVILTSTSSVLWVGVFFIFVGSIAGVICAFTSCPCCGELSGVFIKNFYGGVLPVGKCIHCNISYLKAKGCGNKS